ncbi:MAG: hypothetical protein FJ096_22035, partial [Deltaproteobacteria bacterium]|nr:hypothetical protein [Deltaproteobacteria bacterium]
MKRALSTALLLAPFLGACGDCGSKAPPKVEPSASPTAALEPSASASSSLDQRPPPEPTGAPAFDDGKPGLTEAEANALVKPGTIALEVLSTGAEPRRKLRHRAKAGTRARIAFDYDVAMMQTTAGQDPSARPVPALAIGVALTRVAGDGKAGWTVAIDSAKATPDGDLEKLLAEEVAPLLASLVGKKATLLSDDRIATPLDGARPEGLDREALQIWSSVDEAVRDLEVSVPQEAVGVGAKWRVTSRLRRAGMAYVRTTEFERVEGKGLALRGTFTERPIATKARDPMMPEGMNVTASGGDGSGKLT